MVIKGHVCLNQLNRVQIGYMLPCGEADLFEVMADDETFFCIQSIEIISQIPSGEENQLG